MGRITIFSIEECNFCRRTKAALKARDIPYSDINIEHYPTKRADMISLTGRTSVPQVFFNEEHVGGSEETLAALSGWDEGIGNGDFEDETPRDVYVRIVESKPDPADGRLALPTGPPAAVQKFDLSAPRSKEIFRIGDKRYASLDLAKLLVREMPRDSLSYWGCHYYNVFTGSSGVAALQKTFRLETREEAVQLGLELQGKNYLDHVTKDHPFGDNEYYFRLQPFHTPAILNSFCVWSNPLDDEPMYVIHRLAKMWGKLESGHLTKDGMVDHAAICDDDLYWKFEEEACELQGVSLKDMDEDARMAFVINLYNLMIKYAFCKVGIPATTADRGSFYDDVLVNVGGSEFSFNDLEHGILRANTRHPYKVSKQFGARDPRGELALKGLDPRLHLSLNCGARSCPPVKKYTAEAIDEELGLSATAFCEQEDNVCIDEKNRQLRLSKIFDWYMSDFARSKGELPRNILPFLKGERKERLEKILEGGGLAVKFVEYDWSTNNVNTRAYAKGDLRDRSANPFSRPPKRS